MVFFTIVANPWERTVSAYGEISAYCNRTLCKDIPFYRDFKRGEEPQRFIAFLKDFDAGRLPQAIVPGHVYSQTHFVCRIPKKAKASLLRIESPTYWNEIEKLMERKSTLSISREKEQQQIKNRVLYDKKAGRHDKANVLGLAEETSELLTAAKQLVCELFRVDYICLGYSLPLQCLKLMNMSNTPRNRQKTIEERERERERTHREIDKRL